MVEPPSQGLRHLLKMRNLVLDRLGRLVLRFLVLLLLVAVSRLASAETVQVKYHGPVLLDSFACTDVKDASDVSRICYDAAERYMIIRLKTTYYQYCEIDAAIVRGLQTASSKRQYFEARIRGSGSGGPFDVSG